jgi:hypothetical protein
MIVSPLQVIFLQTKVYQFHGSGKPSRSAQKEYRANTEDLPKAHGER